MANRRKGRRTTVVNGRKFAWYVADDSDHEGFWTLFITPDDNWRQQIVFPLTEAGLQTFAKENPYVPLPKQFDRNSCSLVDYHTTEIGNDRHIPATPKLVKMLVNWYAENVWFGDEWKVFE